MSEEMGPPFDSLHESHPRPTTSGGCNARPLPASRANVDGLMLLLDALAAEGRDVMVIPRSQWPTVDLTGVDHIVVEDETWRAWQNAIGYP